MIEKKPALHIWLPFLLAALVLAASAQISAQAPAAQDNTEKDLLKVFHTISSHNLLAYAAELTSEKYNGRYSGTAEYLKAAQWVADNLKAWGLKPYGDGGSYFQYFDAPYCVIKNPGVLSMQIPQKGTPATTKAYAFPKDFYPGNNSDAGTVSGEAVYVGYGITAPELGYDDYKGLDIKGKIVVLDSGLPYNKEDATFPKWVPYSYHQYKQTNAFKHGAAGMLYIGKVVNPNTLFQKGFVYCHISEGIVADLFEGTGKKYETVKDLINKTLKPASLKLGKIVTLTQDTEFHPEGKACNVVGVVEGTDIVLKNEVIIIGGHLDAVGNNGLLMPGALDNASGAVDMMGAAQALAASPVKLKRSVMFLFIGGEENGLLGSTYYTQHPIFSKDKTICFFNLDMVGNGMGLSLGGGLSYPKIYRFWEEANAKYLHRTLRSSESRLSAGRPRADSVIFSRAGFRTMGIGATDGVKKIFYHDPGDTIDTLTPEIMEDVAKWIFLAVTGMANADSLLD